MAVTIKKFEDILVWQKARIFSVDIYGAFGSLKDYGFRDQICRASVSVMNNIAEGYERRGDKELRHYLYMSKGSIGEVRSMLILGQDLNYIDINIAKRMIASAEEISKMLSGFIKKLV